MNRLQNISPDGAQPVGLRERNREEKHRRILESASALFKEWGYDSVKIEEIAAAAGVSVGTIYNYYKNKGDVLVAIVSMEVDEVITLGEAIVAKPPRNPFKAIDALFMCYIEHSLTYLNKSMWRQAMAISMAQPSSPSGITYVELDHGLEDQVARLVRSLITDGALPKKTEALAVASVLFHAVDNLFINYVKNDAESLAELKSKLKRNNRMIIKLLAEAED